MQFSAELVLDQTDHNSPIMFGPEVADAVVRLAEVLAVDGG